MDDYYSSHYILILYGLIPELENVNKEAIHKAEHASHDASSTKFQLNYSFQLAEWNSLFGRRVVEYKSIIQHIFVGIDIDNILRF